MLTRHLTAAAATIFFAHIIEATPLTTDVFSTASVSPYPDSVLYSWSTDPLCTSAVKKFDCQAASTALCARSNLAVSGNATVGDCTAFYLYDTGNSVPTTLECEAAYTWILAKSIGGALGYDTAHNRTHDPLYAVYPADGNANCFKAPGDTSPVLAPNQMPDGSTLPTCPVGTSRRRRALEVLEGRDQAETEDDGVVKCIIEDGIWGLSCNAVCLATVTASTWM